MKLKTSESKQFFLKYKGKKIIGRAFGGIVCGYILKENSIIVLAESTGFRNISTDMYVDPRYHNHPNGYYVINVKNAKLL